MINQVIPEASVIATALEVGLGTHDWEMFEARTGDVAEAVEIAIRAALQAAAPHLTERAYNAGHLDGMNGAPNTNPYRSSK